MCKCWRFNYDIMGCFTFFLKRCYQAFKSNFGTKLCSNLVVSQIG